MRQKVTHCLICGAAAKVNRIGKSFCSRNCRRKNDRRTDKYRAKLLLKRQLRAEIVQKLQDGKCAICGDLMSGKSMHHDHDHKTGEWRGWLCHWCNTGIGMFRDDISRLRNAISYLQKYSVTH